MHGFLDGSVVFAQPFGQAARKKFFVDFLL
jgi:hypothetical protein